jgi:hypothetical protein
VDRHDRPAGSPPGDRPSAADGAFDAAGAFLRRLIPFPTPDALSPLPLLPSATRADSPTVEVATSIPRAIEQQASSIVSQAASILDEEMARGVLAARASRPAAGVHDPQQVNPWLRQMHELLGTLATIWPQLQNATPTSWSGSQAAATETATVPEIRPAAPVRPGQHAILLLTLRNDDSRTVRVIPIATDLLGSHGDRIGSGNIEYSPTEFALEPGEQRDLSIRVVVPAGAVAGSYSGLLMVRHMEYLRAVITISVQ